MGQDFDKILGVIYISLDHLDPGCHIILGWIWMIFLGYVRNGKGRSGKRKK